MGSIPCRMSAPALPLPKGNCPIFRDEQGELSIFARSAWFSSIRPMVYILEGKVSWLRLMAITWTSDAARQVCGKAAARWENAQAATGPHTLLQTRA
jgi:hypothetical protein